MGSPLQKQSAAVDIGSAIKEVAKGHELSSRLHNLLREARFRYPLALEISLPCSEREESRTSTAEVEAVGFDDKSRTNSRKRNLHSGTTISYETANEGQTCNTNGEKKNNKAKLQRSHLHSWTTTTRTPFNDGHQWRKYGEKKISNCKMPRCYYRCTHKDDQGCQATKQVQQKDNEDPPIYMVTYNKQHSCKTNFIYSEEFEQFELIVEPPITDPCQLSL
ncbi:probable WRKY transcription factor 70 [Asparagus officinalis]|uniref:probable WRKY transcription factor 70 n=1 Tax=Asparagus officinalis TaxID=4686 RepID=UPI00098E345D|nr:probable WRKY transcription factor 70 [Asparagus officinalis]